MHQIKFLNSIYSKFARTDDTLSDIVRVDQPMIWLFQMARSGGTMMLRLFDGHPDVHVHPMPITSRWPLRGTYKNLQKIHGNFSLSRWNETGWKKQSSNVEQVTVPIEFDEFLYDLTFFHSLPKDAGPNGARARFDAACTARFNAWTNYKHLNERKKLQILHSTIWHHTPITKVTDHFFRIYPEGYIIFIARNPQDWIKSLKSLESEANKPHWMREVDEYIEEYISSYKLFDKLTKSAKRERIKILEFDRLVTDPKSELSRLCSALGISYDSCMETTTVNGIPAGPNSAHKTATKFAPDASVIGHGKALAEQLKDNDRFAVAQNLYEEICSRAI